MLSWWKWIFTLHLDMRRNFKIQNFFFLNAEKEQVVAPKFVERFQTVHVREGEPVSLHCRAVGSPIPHITWQKDGIQIHSTQDCIIQTNGGSSSLHIRQLRVSDSAWYQCTAQNVAGSTATRARLYVEVEQLPIPEPWRLSLPRPTKVIQPEWVKYQINSSTLFLLNFIFQYCISNWEIFPAVTS